MTILVLLLSASLHAQLVRPLDCDGRHPAAAVSMPQSILCTPASDASPSFSKTADVTALSYYDSTYTKFVWAVPHPYVFGTDTLEMVSLSQRFTLPGQTAYLDSAHVFIRQLPLGYIGVEVMSDTARTNPSGLTVHDPNYYHPSTARLDTGRLYAQNVDTARFSTIIFNGKPVPKEFHINLLPTTVSGIRNAYAIMTDSKPGPSGQQTAENARTTFLGVLQGNVYIVQMYGLFMVGGAYINPRVYLVAYVHTTATGVEEVHPAAASFGLHPNYPNPAHAGLTQIPFDLAADGIVSLEIFDVMGRSVRTLETGRLAAGSHVRTLDVHGLPSGLYSARLAQNGAVSSRTLLIAN